MFAERLHPLIAPLGLRGRGLEIGALHHPLVDGEAVEVLYVDHAPTDQIRAKYADDASVGDVVDVDVVWGDRPLRHALDDVLGRGELVDFVVASHVVEHVPDLLGWLGELAGVLRPGGFVALAVPDKRFCFDARRRESDVAEVIEARLTGRRRPPLGAIFDFWTKYDDVDAVAIWAGAVSPPSEPIRDAEALARTLAAASNDDYHDVHCWVFTPRSFLEILRRVTELGLLRTLVLHSLRPTAPGSLEFYVVLERRADDVDDEAGRRQQLAAIDAVDLPAVVTGRPALGFVLSPLEQRLVLAKRRVAGRLRQFLKRSAKAP